MKVNAYAALEAGSPLTEFSFELGDLAAEEVEIAIESCGICHSDLSMVNDDWGMSQYPLVPGHEIIGTITKVGSHVNQRTVGQKVGVGWFTESCLQCHQCLSGKHNICTEEPTQTIVGRHGGFADVVRAHWLWATPLPEGLNTNSAGPLFCGGATVFGPILDARVSPTDTVGVIGIGGLGHLAIQFLAAWGCEVTAFTSSTGKEDMLSELGAHRVVISNDSEALSAEAGRYDFILNTANVPLDWNAYIQALAPEGTLHFVGAVPEPLNLEVFPMLVGNRKVGASPLASPAVVAKMLEFCSRHNISPMVEYFAFNEVNEALDRVRSGKARFRVVLTRDESLINR